ncbi:MAG: VWA domain-containing protein, partial [Actinobacteria bacterium]|nr:VWA domain-containing protein [Actinomycetota bacterium]
MSQATLPRALLFLLLLAACDCNETTPPCEREEPIFGCGATCDETISCRAGLYCDPDEGICTADCAADDDCGSKEICNGDGQCEDAPDMGGDTDGRVARDGPDGCPSVMVSARRVTPTVILVVDQSGSMTASFGGSNRWDALRDSLLDPDDGLIQALEDQVRFGLALYSAEAEGNDSGPPIGECPMLNEVTAAISNYEAIEAVYAAAEPIDETPTGDAIDAILDGWLAMPDRPTDPTIFILATDGEPDRCEELNPQNGQAEAIAAVTRAHDNGIRTFVISVGDDISMA